MKWSLWFCLCGLMSAFPIGLHAGEWSGFRGGEHCGLAANEKPPVHFGPESNVVWKTSIPKGHSSPVVHGDLIFLTAAEGKQLITLCLDRKNGQERWKQTIEAGTAEKIHSMNTLASPTPVTTGQRVFAYFGSLGMVAYDLSGKELWRKALPIPKTSFNQGTGTSPILAGGKLILFQQQGNESYLLAMEPESGKELWRAAMPLYNNSYATPVCWQESGEGRIGLVCAQRFTAFNLQDGKEAWWVSGFSPQVCATPAVGKDCLLITSAGYQGESANITVPPPFDEALKRHDKNGDGKLAYDEIPKDWLYTDRGATSGQGNMSVRQALRMFGGVNEKDVLDQERWETIRAGLKEFATGSANKTLVLAVKTGGKGDVSGTGVLWKETQSVPEVPSPLIYGPRAYFIRSGGVLTCRDLATGKLIFEEKTGARGAYFASPVAADGRIYVVSDRGVITVVEAGDQYRMLARNELEEPVLATPALADNQLYVRTGERLWAFGNR